MGKSKVVGKPALSVLVLVIFLSCSFPVAAVLGNEGDTDRFAGLIVLNAAQSSPYVKPRTYRMIYNLTFLNIDATVDSVELWVPLPVVWDSQKDVTLERTNPEVTKQSTDSQYGNGILYWKLGAVSRGSSKTVTMQVVFTAYEILYKIDPTEVGVYDKASSEYRQYTKSEDYVEAAYAPIQEKARQIIGEETNPYRQARLIYNWVLQHMTYRLLPELGGAKFAYDNAYGECGEYAALFAALSRAVGIPARLVVGLSWDRVGVYPHGEDRGVHVWSEFLLPGYGWVPVDPSRGDGSGRPNDYFASNPDSDHFLIMSKGTNILLKSGFTLPIFQIGAYYYYGRVGKVDCPYRYSVAETQVLTTLTTSQILTTLTTSQVLTTVTVVTETTTPVTTPTHTTLAETETPQPIAGGQVPLELLSVGAIAVVAIVVAGLLYLRKRRTP